MIYVLKERPKIKNTSFVHPSKGSERYLAILTCTAWVRDPFLAEAGKQRNKEGNVYLNSLYEYLCHPSSCTLDM